MRPQLPAAPSKVTPLWIVATFLSLTEVILGYAVTKVSDGVQIALTVFVIVYAVGVAAMFFVILWHRPLHFYSPSEYGNMDPRKFMEALRGSPAVAQQLQLAKNVETDPSNEEAKFSLIDSMAELVESQFIILMHKLGKEIPRYSPYVYEMGEHGAGSGALSPYGKGTKIEGTGLVRIAGSQNQWALTEEGHRFAKWLIAKDRQASFFWTPYGEWGTPRPGGPAADMLAKRKSGGSV